MRTLRWSRWGLLSMCCAAGVMAAEGEASIELFDKLDANKDGQVTVEEVPEEQRPHLERLLRKGDKDENKSLSKEEWEAAHKPEAEPEVGGPAVGKEGRPNPGQMFERMDTNKDGKLQKSEIPEGAPPKIRELLDKAFEKAGKDELSREDMISSMGKMAKDKAGGPGGKGDSGKLIERLKKLDKNNDGKVTTDEFPAEGAERLQGLMSKIGGGDSIDIAKAEEFVERQAAKQAAKMEKKGPGDAGAKKKKRPGEEGGPDGEVGRPEGGPPEGDRPPHLADRGDGPGPDGHGPGQHGPGEHGHRGHGPHGGVMALLDENHDGRLSRDEFSRAATYFGDLDKNHDGAIDAHELMGGPGHGGEGHRGPGGPDGPRGERGFGPPPGAFGPDGEGMRDGDRPRPEGPGGERGRPGFGGPRPEGGPAGPDGPRGPFDPEEFFKRMDKDGDGTISKEEAPERMKDRFDDIDADKNGKLSKDELRTHREKRMGGRGPGGRPGPDGPDGPRPERPAGEGDKPAEEKPADKPTEEAPKA